MQNRFIVITSSLLFFMIAYVLHTKAETTSTGQNAIGIRDTMYFGSTDELCYDTIPYMIYDRYFMEAYDELSKMYNEGTYNLKRAEFLVEWAYEGGNMDYQGYCSCIDSIAGILKGYIHEKGIERYKTAPNYALFEYFTTPSKINGDKAFSYDFNDFTGEKDFRNLFITKVMKTHTGQCTSLPLYYKILCDELGGQSALAFAPKHIYVKHIGEDGKWVNIELTNGHLVRDEWMIQTMEVSTEAIRNGVFLTALSEKEHMGFMLLQLGKAYRQKYKSWDYFPLRCAEEVLKVLPDFCDALVLKFCVYQQLGYAYLNRFGQCRTDYAEWNYSEYRCVLDHLDFLGYSQQTEEEYLQAIEKALSNTIKQE